MKRDAYVSHIAHLRFPGHGKKKGSRRWDGREDKLWKIREFMCTVLSNVNNGWTCYQQLTVDESMIRLKSKRCTFVQYMPVSRF